MVGFGNTINTHKNRYNGYRSASSHAQIKAQSKGKEERNIHRTVRRKGTVLSFCKKYARQAEEGGRCAGEEQKAEILPLLLCLSPKIEEDMIFDKVPPSAARCVWWCVGSTQKGGMNRNASEKYD